MTGFFFRYLVLFVLLCSVPSTPNTWQHARKVANLVSKNTIQQHLNVLGQDSMRGRAPGTVGGRRAASYIAQQLQKFGIAPGNSDGSYFQNVPLHGSMPLKKSQLQLVMHDSTINFELGQDYVLYKSGEQTFLPQPLPLVFVGYGIVAPEFDYNDYHSLDVRGKIVVYLEGEPLSTNFGAEAAIYGLAESKERLAISRGARGSIMISLHNDQQHWQKKVNAYSFEDLTLAYSPTSHFSVVMNQNAARWLFHNAKYSLEKILDMQEKNSVISFPMATRLSFQGTFRERDFISRNVIGKIKGRDPELNNTFLILSAHYDHLGIGPPVEGDSIYNGVIDNAIGAAALLSIAETLQNRPLPKRSVLFVFTTAEETGLLGTQYYLDHPVVPLYRTITNLNIDGLAIFDRFHNVIGVGAQLSTLGQRLEAVTSAFGIRTSAIPDQFLAKESFARSDQIAFAKAGIPSLLVMEGLDYENLTPQQGLDRHIHWMHHIYHTPFDDLNQPINLAAAEQHAKLLAAFAWSLADSETVPHWHPNTPYRTARLQTIAEKR